MLKKLLLLKTKCEDYLNQHKVTQTIVLILIGTLMVKGINRGEANTAHATQVQIYPTITPNDAYYHNKNLLTTEVKEWVDKNCPNHKVDIDYFVQSCITNNLPIDAVVAQCYLETHFGTIGECKKLGTHSIFGVGHYGNGVVKKRYPNDNMAVADYIRKVRHDYLGWDRNDKYHNTLTYNDLLHNEFKRCDNGMRYAGGSHYEESILKVIDRLRNETNIYELEKIVQQGCEMVDL